MSYTTRRYRIADDKMLLRVKTAMARVPSRPFLRGSMSKELRFFDHPQLRLLEQGVVLVGVRPERSGKDELSLEPTRLGNKKWDLDRIVSSRAHIRLLHSLGFQERLVRVTEEDFAWISNPKTENSTWFTLTIERVEGVGRFLVAAAYEEGPDRMDRAVLKMGLSAENLEPRSYAELVGGVLTTDEKEPSIAKATPLPRRYGR